MITCCVFKLVCVHKNSQIEVNWSGMCVYVICMCMSVCDAFHLSFSSEFRRVCTGKKFNHAVVSLTYPQASLGMRLGIEWEIIRS